MCLYVDGKVSNDFCKTLIVSHVCSCTIRARPDRPSAVDSHRLQSQNNRDSAAYGISRRPPHSNNGSVRLDISVMQHLNLRTKMKQLVLKMRYSSIWAAWSFIIIITISHTCLKMAGSKIDGVQTSQR